MNTAQNSNSSSPHLKSHYLADLDLLESPVVGLLTKPLEDFTDEELRDFVQRQRTLRDSRQSFKAAVVATSSPKETKEQATKNAALFADF